MCGQSHVCAAASIAAAHGNQGDLNFHDAEASARKAESARKRSEDIATGTVQMNGRELFLHEPWVFDNTQY